jgi:hypothetical protein
MGKLIHPVSLGSFQNETDMPTGYNYLDPPVEVTVNGQKNEVSQPIRVSGPSPAFRVLVGNRGTIPKLGRPLILFHYLKERVCEPAYSVEIPEEPPFDLR